RATGSLDQVQLADVSEPAVPLGPREVRVAIRAAALNHLDLFVVRGLPHGHTFPHILGADGAGVVAAVGTEVRSVRLGDRVMLNPGISDYTCEYCRAGEHSLCVNYRMLGEHLPGTLCESVIVPEQNVAIIPTVTPPLNWAEAAAFSLVTLTAWRMVVTRAQRRAVGDVRRHDRPRRGDRPAAAFLVSLEHPGFDDGERRRVPGGRRAAGEWRAAADRGPRLPARGGASGVRAPGQRGAAGEDRGAGARLRKAWARRSTVLKDIRFTSFASLVVFQRSVGPSPGYSSLGTAACWTRCTSSAWCRVGRTRRAPPSSATCWGSITRTATSPCTTPWCAWCRTSRCGTRSSTVRGTLARWTGTQRRRIATPKRASPAWR